MNSPASTTKPRASANRVITGRVTDEQWHHLLAQATLQGLTLSETIRRAVQRDLEAQPDLGHEDGSPGTSMSYRTLLQVADFSAALEELQARGDD